MRSIATSMILVVPITVGKSIKGRGRFHGKRKRAETENFIAAALSVE